MPQDVKGTRRTNLLRLQINSISPYANPGIYTHLIGDHVNVWIWDNNKVEDAIDSTGSKPSQFSIVPETSLKEPLKDGIRLIQGLEGVEGQVWTDGSLINSRWWLKAPTDEDWKLFTRTAGVTSDLPEVQARAPWLKSAWTKNNALQEFAFSTEMLVEYLPYAAVFIIAPLLFLLTHSIHMNFKVSSIDSALIQLEKEIEPTLKNKKQAEEYARKIKQLLALSPYPEPLQLLTFIAEKLPPNDAQVTKMRYQKQKLFITLASSHSLDASFYVKLFEKSPTFENVSAQTDQNQNELNLTLSVKKIW